MDKINKISVLDTKRNKRNKSEQTELFRFGQQRNTRNNTPVGGCSCSDAPDLEKTFPAPRPGSPGSPERAAEQRIRNERAARMADALARTNGVDLAEPGEDRTVISMLLAIRIESEANLSGHWRGKAARVKLQRSIVCTMVGQKLREIGIRPRKLLAGEENLIVTLTRVAPRPLDDDNLARALKAVRDGVADAFKTDDSAKSKLRWEYGQEKGPPKQYAVRIQIQTGRRS